jgi:hypothetical protein
MSLLDRMLDRGPAIYLSPGMIARARVVGRMRQANAIEEARIPGNNLVAHPQRDLAMHIFGCCGECAGKCMLPMLRWNDFKRGPLDDTPDLEDDKLAVDVKAIEKHQHRLLVQAGKVQREWAYLLISGEYHPYWWVAGWAWGHEVLRARIEEPQPNRPAHVLDIDRLRLGFDLQTIAGS